MYIPKRRSSLSQQINDSDLVFEDDDEHTFGPGPVGCFNCCRSMTKTRRRSSSSFKVGSIIDSLLVDRTSASKSKPIEFKFNLSITDFSYHIKKGGQPPTVPKRIQAPIDVQYVEWQDTIGFGTTKLATMSNSNFSPTSSPFSTPLWLVTSI